MPQDVSGIPQVPVTKEIEDDLATLRKGPGLTLDRLREADAVVKACSDRGAEPPIETIRDRVVSAMQKLRPTPHGAALWAAFGLDGDHTGTLEERRRRYGRIVGKQPDTLSRWENKAIRELALRLTTRYYGAPPVPADLPMPQHGLFITALEVVTVIRDRRFVASIQTRTVLSLVDGAEHFVYGTYSPTELSLPVGCTIEPPRHLPGGTLHKIVFDPALNRGDAHTFQFMETEPGGAQGEPPSADFAGQTFESPTKHYVPVVRFEGDVPPLVWGYHQLSRIERPGTPENGIRLTVPESGVVSLGLADMYAGMCSGIAWSWE